MRLTWRIPPTVCSLDNTRIELNSYKTLLVTICMFSLADKNKNHQNNTFLTCNSLTAAEL